MVDVWPASRSGLLNRSSSSVTGQKKGLYLVHKALALVFIFFSARLYPASPHSFAFAPCHTGLPWAWAI
ncbi:hypothetical protein MHYP_G00183940 [Metynnis hypsauchen]